MRACCQKGVALTKRNQSDAIPIADLRAPGVALQDDELLLDALSQNDRRMRVELA